jgi:hypothetical protein
MDLHPPPPERAGDGEEGTQVVAQQKHAVRHYPRFT